MTAPVALLVDLEFDGGPMYLWNGMYPLSYGGNTYIGAGDLLQVASIDETMELKASGTRITLSGVDPTILGNALVEPYQGRQATIQLGFLDSAGAVSGVQLLGGFLMDVMSIDEGGETSTVSLTLESRLSILDKSSPRRLTLEDQLLDFPGDLGLEFVTTSVREDPAFGAVGQLPGGGTAGNTERTRPAQ